VRPSASNWTTAVELTALDSWAATGFDQRSLSKTFAIASEANGILAVIAGLVAQVAADIMGEIGPFRVAVVITALASVFVLQWPENYGTKASESTSSSEVCAEGEAAKREVASDARLKCYSLGFAYSLFEGAMYIFGKTCIIDRIGYANLTERQLQCFCGIRR
jgi:hypothetical protein